jgi:hypothetical protein
MNRNTHTQRHIIISIAIIYYFNERLKIFFKKLNKKSKSGALSTVDGMVYFFYNLF